jgi:hypothetical protein
MVYLVYRKEVVEMKIVVCGKKKKKILLNQFCEGEVFEYEDDLYMVNDIYEVNFDTVYKDCVLNLSKEIDNRGSVLVTYLETGELLTFDQTLEVGKVKTKIKWYK